ncbi:MAG: response regulator [Scytolyngbya sp. HA4215-MV1]|jgi:signal transduction histidine kinase|nr:response regulator [Scytolyngbya sp. HA4215-MV1]
MRADSKVNILLVDDHNENLVALEAVLSIMEQNLVKARSGEEALRCLLSQDFAVILLDVQMPDIDGFETAHLIRQRPRSQHTPIIFITGFSTSEMWQMKGYALGAVDYLLKPIDPAILISKVTVFVELFKKTAEVQRQAAELATQKVEIIREQLARQQAESDSRMKDEFLAIVSHELRTPLNAILGWSKLLQTKNLDAETTHRALKVISRNAQSQVQLIDDILDVARLMRGKLHLNCRPVNLLHLISAELESIAPSAEAKQIHLNKQFSSTPCIVLGDSERLQQVVRNLLSNAIKFTSEGGTVEVSLSVIANQRIPDPLVLLDTTIEPTPMEQIVQIKVSDTGVGIHPEFLPHIFEYFRQADSSSTRTHNGLGLGLAIVHQLIDLHGGKIYAASDGHGKGATFTIHLPLFRLSPSLSPPYPEPVLEQSKASLSLHAITVLVVDDNADNREFIKTALEQMGAQVEVMANGNEVMEYLQHRQPDVFVSDIAMPDEDGYDLLNRVRAFEREKGIKIPAIALTAYTKQEDQTQALAAGFEMFLSKPIDPLHLANAIVQLARVQTQPLR